MVTFQRHTGGPEDRTHGTTSARTWATAGCPVAGLAPVLDDVDVRKGQGAGYAVGFCPNYKGKDCCRSQGGEQVFIAQDEFEKPSHERYPPPPQPLTLYLARAPFCCVALRALCGSSLVCARTRAT